jgi:hypothetical protein
MRGPHGRNSARQDRDQGGAHLHLRRAPQARLGADRLDDFPARIVEVHLAAGELAEDAQYLTLFVTVTIGAAGAIVRRRHVRWEQNEYDKR